MGPLDIGLGFLCAYTLVIATLVYIYHYATKGRG